ncbi:MAG: hypothetical protein JXX14_09355, partial [Deltaproteobacteria bacterium]|nr:hypothetical protein [Deltaproteobacteria bacterium]
IVFTTQDDVFCVQKIDKSWVNSHESKVKKCKVIRGPSLLGDAAIRTNSSADRVHCTPTFGAVKAPPAGFAIHSDMLSGGLKSQPEQIQPCNKHFTERLRMESCKNRPIYILRGIAMRQLKKIFQQASLISSQRSIDYPGFHEKLEFDVTGRIDTVQPHLFPIV